MTADQRLSANPLLEVSDFDSDSRKPLALCVLPTADEPVRFALPAIYVDLVRGFDGKRSTDQVIDEFLDQHPGTFEREWLRQLIAKSLAPKGLLVDADQDPARVAASTQPKRAFLYVKLPILPPKVVEPVARLLGVMFTRPALLIGVLLFVASHIYIYGYLLRGTSVDFNQLNAGSILILMLLSTAGTLCHEFGHASAAAHYGCRRMSIGWGLYLVYTVLWTNVSEAWRLPRRQRAVIDIGGVYFESLFQLLMVYLFVRTANPIFLFAVVMIDINIVMTLNPFIRMDGYWMMSDLFGIVNLRQQQTAWLDEMIARLMNRPSPTSRTTLSKRAKSTLAIYSCAGAIFMVYLFIVIFQFVILNIADSFPAMVSSYWNQAIAGMSPLDLAGGFVELFWRMMILAGASVMLVSFSWSGVRMIARIGILRSAGRSERTA